MHGLNKSMKLQLKKCCLKPEVLWHVGLRLDFLCTLLRSNASADRHEIFHRFYLKNSLLSIKFVVQKCWAVPKGCIVAMKFRTSTAMTDDLEILHIVFCQFIISIKF